ncbi:hypothetical protein JOD54_003016 [Actinokineospora baliensis]|uniref:HAAS signaling domain-containing protein n=1 Tax=Actinokineospora baliensis TaxID=547056 RepID=UPI001958ADAC|nr:hypothetical protein [Actinokineospora baliensis]MBM7772812.1 hypothetical protein [Actinokineospora baliensis]
MSAQTKADPGLAEYLGRVRAALADLPADELAEVMEDVEPHVTEVFAETGDLEGVVGRLGTPEAYAAELRAAGGYPPPGPTGGKALWSARYVLLITVVSLVVAFATGLMSLTGSDDKFAVLGLCAVFAIPALMLLFTDRVRPTDVEALGSYRFARRGALAVANRLPHRAVAYLRSLRPAWWLLRVLLVVVTVMADREESALVVLAVVVLVSWAGPRSREDRRLLPVVVVANTFLAGVAIALLALGIDSSTRDGEYYPYSPNGLYYNGSYVSNLYAVDEDGNAIPQFYLYDEDGNPLKLYGTRCEADVNGQDYDNRFPLPHVEYRGRACVQASGLPFVPLPPGATDRTPAKPTRPTSPGAPTSTAPTTAPTTTAATPSVTPTTSAPTTTPGS